MKNLQLFEAKEEEKKLQRLSTIIDEGAWNGDREELPFHVADSTWSNLCSESDRCMSAKCPFRETCHYHKQRKYLESCHLIVVNHALFAAHLRLYQDTAGKTLLLPGHEAVIFDEAHHLEGVFRDSLTFDVGYNHLKRLSDDALRMASREPFSKLLPGGERERIESALQLSLIHICPLFSKLPLHVFDAMLPWAKMTKQVLLFLRLTRPLTPLKAPVLVFLPLLPQLLSGG